MSTKLKFVFVLLAGVFILAAPACKRKKKVPEKQKDTFMAGNADLLIDESCAPIVEEELFVFKSHYPEAKPRLVYKSENELLSLLLTDSIPYAIMSRDLTADEKRLMVQHTRPADVNRFATDAISLIVNQASTDTTITVSQVKAMLRGEAGTDRSVVFDNPNSSLVRYLKELAQTKDLNAKNIYALKNNKEVIRYVATHPNAIGITGFCWLNDPDKDYAADVKKVKIVGVKDDSRKDDIGFTKPSQESLALKTYPFIRSLYIVDCTGRRGLGAGIASFILSDRGQRIILKSGILPEVMPGREINIVKEQNTERIN